MWHVWSHDFPVCIESQVKMVKSSDRPGGQKRALPLLYGDILASNYRTLSRETHCVRDTELKLLHQVVTQQTYM